MLFTYSRNTAFSPGYQFSKHILKNYLKRKIESGEVGIIFFLV